MRERIEGAERKSGELVAAAGGGEDQRFIILDRDNRRGQADLDWRQKLVAHLPAIMGLFELDEERLSLDHHARRTDALQRTDHPSVAAERLVGETYDQLVGRGDRGGGAELPCD